MDELQLPQKFNLFNFTGMVAFQNSETGKPLLQKYHKVKKQTDTELKWLKYGMIAAIVLGLSTVIYFWGIFLLILAYFMRKKGLFANMIKTNLNQISDEYDQEYIKYNTKLIEKATQKIMTDNWRSMVAGSKGLVYNSNEFFYYELGSGLLVAYNDENIKEVSRERVHVGSHTVSSTNTTGFGSGHSSGKANFWSGSNGFATSSSNSGNVLFAHTSGKSDTNDIYEWHFDILTNFADYPKVSFVVPDSKQAEDAIGEAYAILKP
ncbi:hypothetical protein M3M39_00805 [Fructilactobacillus hinvesii]|uniref:Uncharacterized protein n=1 Tax=Fructilactobacillus hinvesii TaxID=2940300 RepID=A0ABY5BSF7_9LACO|nr:hypothetical protein [Fructilactobacillus hinvesii]USS88058.1 hypothetical protein M3M39_00805 [Fructilactobacillus hinvesii]